MVEALFYFFDEFLAAVGLVGRDPVEHFVEDGAGAVDIDLVGVGLPLEDFGGHVEGRAGEGLEEFAGVKFPSQTKIHDLYISVLEHYVRGFEVAVDDVHALHAGHPAHQLREQPQRLHLRQPSVLGDVLRQVPPLAVLQKYVEVALRLLDVHKIDDPLVLAAPQQVDLPFETDLLGF